jgi:hypothetical protein
VLKVLGDADIRGYQEANWLKSRVGHRGIWENEVAELTNVPTLDVVCTETTDFTLFEEGQICQDGTGETRRTLSWIWTSASGDSNPDAADNIVRSEWAKSRARAARACEEVLLLQEEMQRTLEFLQWKARWWLSRSDLKSAEPGVAEGLRAFAHEQAALQLSLSEEFRSIWQQSLRDQEAENRDGNDEDDEDDGEDDGDEDGDEGGGVASYGGEDYMYV